MRICIDSCVFIRCLRTADSELDALMECISSGNELLVPRLVTQEVTCNLQTPAQVTRFFHLFSFYKEARIVDDVVPLTLFRKYVDFGLREKGDAYIGAFAEWVAVDYLLSDNRHFLRELQTDAFAILEPKAFLMLMR